MKTKFLDIKVGQFICFGICLLLMVVIPISRERKIIGINLEKNDGKTETETVSVTEDGETVINTTLIGKDIIGYSGNTPVAIHLKDGKITRVEALPNQETPEFFGAVTNSDLLDQYNGLTLKEAYGKKLDAVSGATYTSNALIGNMKKGVAFALDPENMPKEKTAVDKADFNILKFIITIIIILSGAVVPLFFKNRNFRTAQLILNVLLLGFWGGTFISYSLMVSFLTNGITKVILIPVALMLVTAFIYPMFGRADHYCNWLCPYGSIQELAGKLWKKKIQLSTTWIKGLNIFRNALWFALMWLLWTGLWFDWMGYEPFAAFFFTDASAVVLGIAGGFLLLSIFIQRPYCRFVCPTGSLFKLSEGRK